MKYLVTGHKGFIGSTLYQRLKKAGHTVYGLDLGDNFPTCRVDFVYHLAAYTNAYDSIDHPEIVIDNIQVTYEVLQWMRKTKSHKMIYTSSREAYRPMNPYGASKLMCEVLAEPYVQTYGLGVVNARLANIYGSGNKGYRFIHLCIERARENKDIFIYGGKEKVVNFLHLNDCVDQLLKLQGECQIGKSQTLEIAYPVSYLLYEVAERIIKKLGSKSKIVMVKGRRGEVMSYNPARVYDMPKINLDEGIDLCL